MHCNSPSDCLLNASTTYLVIAARLSLSPYILQNCGADQDHLQNSFVGDNKRVPVKD